MELLPCPFCGSKPDIARVWSEIEASEMGPGTSEGYISIEYVVCPECGARHHAPNKYSRYNWNTRV